MSILDLFRIVVRQWRVVVPVLVVTGLAAAAVQVASPPEYLATGLFVVEPPELAVSDRPSVDLLQFAEGIRLDDEDERSAFSIGPLGSLSYWIRGNASTPQHAVDNANAVASDLEGRLASYQEDGAVPEAQRASLRVLSPATAAVASSGDTYAATVTVLVDDPSVGSPNPYTPGEETVRLLTLAVGSDANRIRFAQEVDPSVTYGVDQAAPEQGEATIEVFIWGPDPTMVVDGYYSLHELMAQDFRERQEAIGFLPRQQSRLEILDAPTSLSDESPLVSRSAAALVAVGVVVALGLAILRESAERRRRRDLRWLVDPTADAADGPKPERAAALASSRPNGR